MQLHSHPRTHLTLDYSPRSTPIPGSFSQQDYILDNSNTSVANNISDNSNIYNNNSNRIINCSSSARLTVVDEKNKLPEISSSSAMPSTPSGLGIKSTSQINLLDNDITSNSNINNKNNSTIINCNNNNDHFYYSASKTIAAGNNSNHLRFHQHRLDNSSNTVPSHRHNHSHSSQSYRQDIASTRDAFLSNSDLSMITDDDASSTASFHQRPRKVSKAGSMPSPLSGALSSFSPNKNISTNALSTLSFFPPSGGKSSTTHNNNSTSTSNSNNNINNSIVSNSNSNSTIMDTNSKSLSQLRVRHLEQYSTYAGYLTKFSSRTFFSRKQWKRRYFILSEKSLYCFKSSDPQHSVLESIELSSEAIICVTDMFAGKRYCLQISAPGEKAWYVLADTASEMSGWLKELKNAVQRFRNKQSEGGHGAHFSDMSEVSDMSGTSTVIRMTPTSALANQYDYMASTTRSLPATLPSSAPGRQGHHPSVYSQLPHQQVDNYQGQSISLNPPPRSISPKPSTSTSGTDPQRTAGGAPLHGYKASQGQSTELARSQQPQQPETRRRRNSSLSSGQPVTDYASFGTVMQQAEAMAEEQKESPSSSWSMPTKTVRSLDRLDTNYATLPRAKRESTMPTQPTLVSAPLSHRASMVMEQSDGSISQSVTLRNVQRVNVTNQQRPASPTTSRPLSPSMSRTSPRNSLVISPPPRSIHRPISVSMRHSTQILPPPQIVTAGLPSQSQYVSTPTNSSPLRSNPPTASLPPTPGPSGEQNNSTPLARITSVRHQRDPRIGLYRHSVINVGSNAGAGSLGNGDSIQGHVQRSSSRASLLRSGFSSRSLGSADLIGLNRPLSPTPSLSSAPTLPLPDPPGPISTSPNKSTASVSTSSPTAVTTSSTEPFRRNSTVPRHHEPELPIPNRSKARVRAQSQEAALLAAELGNLQLSRRATSPSPRLAAISTSNRDRQSMIVVGESGRSNGNDKGNGSGNNNVNSNNSNSQGGHSRQMSLPIHTMYALPAPPAGQAPTHPLSSTPSGSPPSSSRPLLQRPSGSGVALRPISSVMNNVASLGGGIARRPSTTNATAAATASKRELALASRLSALIALPPGPTTTVPLPPKGALPAPPTTALPKKPSEVLEDEEEDERREWEKCPIQAPKRTD
ncbi:hypothetical protein BCR41DRAFT_207039 [Lobosporangium transversale]|uniref:PH domain-containing protein n=1 Tax=Lobosporangium transversale TaxID=64571 RepID=A0A1Y2G895_9FUNG|nr:hypothetical protein BCR41DRAFT_207039 [Lobosporangium transversale]ORZ04054.1 hypothetical protein BCR41DRAFT_207039 [Lobosporangium transversale]|eukprot:XP_021876331.1 hypothetical protein BCR41DRAFT_207039 [Lobosporangium transversale]